MNKKIDQILTRAELKILLPAPFYDLYFHKQESKYDNWNYIVGGKGIGKSWFWCLIIIYSFTNIKGYNAIVSRRLFDYIRNSKDQFNATLNFLDGAETNNGSQIEKDFKIKPKRLGIQFHITRTGNEIFYNGNNKVQKVKLLAYDKPNSWSSLQAEYGAFKEIFNDECVRYNDKEGKITINSMNYNKYISDVFRAKRDGIRNWFIYNPTRSNWIDEIAVDIDPYDDAKLEYIKKNGFSFVNEKFKNRNYNILRCSFLISKFDIEEIKRALETSKALYPDYYLFEAYGKPLTNFMDGVSVYNIDKVSRWVQLPNRFNANLDGIMVGFDWGKIDRCIMTLVGLFNYREMTETFERIVILKEVVLEFPEKFKNSLESMDYLWKEFGKWYRLNYSWIHQFLPFKFYYQANDYIIIDYLKKKLQESNIEDMFIFQKAIPKNEKGWLKEDKYIFMEFLLNTSKLYYLNYPEILMKNLKEYQKDQNGMILKLRDEDGFDAFIDTLVDIRHLI